MLRVIPSCDSSVDTGPFRPEGAKAAAAEARTVAADAESIARDFQTTVRTTRSEVGW